MEKIADCFVQMGGSNIYVCLYERISHPTSTFSNYEDHDQQGKSGQQESYKSAVADGDDEQLDVHM
jgi:hypothetical protein